MAIEGILRIEFAAQFWQIDAVKSLIFWESPHLVSVVRVVPSGGIEPDGKSWIVCKPGFFLPAHVLSRMFRGLFLHYLERAFAAGALNFFSQHRHLHELAAFHCYLAPTRATEWFVYAKRPFAGPAQVLEYVARYTRRVAISNNRLISIDDGKVHFRWKDYRQENRQKVMTLTGWEFIRRFLIHALPDGFHRIRYYGFLGNCHRTRKLVLCRTLLGMISAAAADQPIDDQDKPLPLSRVLRQCPHCRMGWWSTVFRPPASASWVRTRYETRPAFQWRIGDAPAGPGWKRSRPECQYRTGGQTNRPEQG
jgi:hypothetical protein